jgi:hypothetical protein
VNAMISGDFVYMRVKKTPAVTPGKGQREAAVRLRIGYGTTVRGAKGARQQEYHAKGFHGSLLSSRVRQRRASSSSAIYELHTGLQLVTAGDITRTRRHVPHTARATAPNIYVAAP